MKGFVFEERQGFHWFAYAAVGAAIIGSLVASLIAFMTPGETEKLSEAWWLPLVIGLAFVAGINVFHMRTTVRSEQITVQFGYFFPMYRKRIPFDTVQKTRVVEYRPLRDAGGWGIRFGRFEKEPCRFLNCRGNRGVYVETEKRRYIIGSQKPEALRAALAKAVERESDRSV
jgi:hypothetical protein